MVVVQGIINDFPLASVFNDSKGSQNPKLVGYGRFALSAKHGKITDTMFTVQKCRDNFYPGGICQCLEYFGKTQDCSGAASLPVSFYLFRVDAFCPQVSVFVIRMNSDY